MQPPTTGPAPANNEQSLQEAIERAREVLGRRRWWFIFSALLTMAATVLITHAQPRIYEAHGTLYIDRVAPRVLSGMQEVVPLGAAGYWGSASYYDAQPDLLRSRELAQMVVDRLGLATDHHFLGLDRGDAAKLSDEEKQRLVMASDPAGLLARRITVRIGKAAMIIRVVFEDTDPEFAKTVVNGILEAYKERNLQYRGRATRVANRELRTILRDMQKRKEASETALFEFETKHNLSDNRRKALNERLLSLEASLRRVQAARFRAGQRARTLRKYRHTPTPFATGAESLLDDVLLRILKQKRLDIELRLRLKEASLLDRHPQIMALKAQLKEVARLTRTHLNALYTAAATTYQSAVAEEKELQRQLSAARNEDKELRALKTEHAQLLADRAEDTKFYDMVARRMTETDLSGQVDVNNIRVLDHAVTPKVPVRPNVRLNYAAGLILALLIGLGTALGVNMLDNTIKGRYEVEELLKVPYLGAIPKFDLEAADEGEQGIPAARQDLYAHYRPNSRVAEASRTLRTNILFMRPDAPIKTLLVSSALPREGKTSTSTILATALAAASGSCLLVDTDLRKPRLHKIFEIKGDRGITSSVLTGAPIDDFIQPTLVEGLFLLPCGPLPPNSAEIMHTERFKQLVVELKQKFSTVVFDSPPIEIVSDALVLANHVDGVIVVAHANHSKLDSVGRALRSLRSVNARLLGCVLSRAESTGSGYGYYYGKGYHHGGGRPYRYRYATARDDEDTPRMAG